MLVVSSKTKTRWLVLSEIANCQKYQNISIIIIHSMTTPVYQFSVTESWHTNRLRASLSHVEPCYGNLFSKMKNFIILFAVTTRIGLHAVVLKNATVFSFCLVLLHCIPPLPDTLCVSSCLFKLVLDTVQEVEPRSLLWKFLSHVLEARSSNSQLWKYLGHRLTTSLAPRLSWRGINYFNRATFRL